MPVAIGATPITFATALRDDGSVLRAVGAAAASVTGPARAAAEPIIGNDLTLVLPKAQNALRVSLVELINVGSAAVAPGQLLQAVDTARTNIAAALDQPIGVRPGPTGAANLPQVVAVEGVNIASAVLFQAGESALLGVVQTADVAAQTLADTANLAAAVSAGATQAAGVGRAARRTVTDAVETANTHIRRSLRNPFPATSPTAARRTEPARAYPPTDFPRLGDMRFNRSEGRSADRHLHGAEAQLSQGRKRPVGELKSQLTQGDRTT